MNTDHHTYPNPTIQEALCEIHFRLPDGMEWKPLLLGELFKHLQPDFPDLEPVTEIGFQLQVGPGRFGQVLLPPQQMMRYKHATRNMLLQLSANVFTVNLLPQYPGWTQMSADVLHAWARLCQAIHPASITRIGLRYINLIARTHPDERPGDWLAPNDYLPRAALASRPVFLARLETHTDPHNQLIVTLGETTSGSEPASRAIVLDIDCIVEKMLGIDEDTIVAETSRLHDIAWHVFSASLTPRLERVLRGEVGGES